MQLLSRFQSAFVVMLGLLGAQGVACGDDPKAREGGEAGHGGSGGSEVAAGGSSAAPTGEGGSGGDEPAEPGVYLLAKHVQTGDAWTSYVDTAAVDAPSKLAEFDALTDGIELDGYVVPLARHGAVFVPDAVAPTITRYEVDDDGELVEGDRLDFAGVGITGVFDPVLVFVSAEKAYVLDTAGQRAVVWDPAKMVLTGDEIDLKNPDREGYDPWFWGDAARVKGGKLLVPIEYANDSGAIREAGLVVIDTTTDTLEKHVADERCGRLHVAVDVGADTYYFPNAGHAREEYLDLAAPRAPLCGLRVREGTDEFDGDVLDFATLTGGDETAGGGVQGGFADGRGGFYFAVADEGRYADAENNGFAFFRLWHYDLETATVLSELPWWTAAMSRQTRFGSESLIISYGLDEDEQETTIVYEGASEPLSSFTIPGSHEPVARVR